MSAEAKEGRGVPTIILEAIEHEDDIGVRTHRARLLRQEAEDLLRKGFTKRIDRRFGRKSIIILETEIENDSGRRVKVKIIPRDNLDLGRYEADLKNAAIEIKVGHYDSLLLPPAGKSFNIRTLDGTIKFPLPDSERIEQYGELLEAVREDIVNLIGKEV